MGGTLYGLAYGDVTCAEQCWQAATRSLSFNTISLNRASRPEAVWGLWGTNPMRLLVVEDNARLAEYVSIACRAKGFAVDPVESLADAGAALASIKYDIVVLDLGLPDGDGIGWLQSIRRANVQTPVLILTARDEARTVVESLDVGADDYLTKPFNVDVLLARIRALLRRPGRALSATLAEGNITLDTAAREVRVSGEFVELGRRETDSLELLLRRAGHVVAKSAMNEAIYAYGEELASNAIEVLIHRLRKRLREAGADMEIHTVRGVGYMLSARSP
jgi:two-component system response regulator QseB